MDFSQIVAKQRQYFNSGATKPVSARIAALKKLAAALEAWEPQFLDALRHDLGKSGFEGWVTEIGMVRGELKEAIRHVKQWSAPRRVPTPITQFPARSYVLREPYGVALIMAPWNYPVQLNLVPVVSALAAGCTVVLKPSAYAAATAEVLAKMLSATFPPELVTVVTGGRAENTALLEQHFDVIFFTGSTEVGKTVMAAAAQHLTPVALELGGKSPVILTRNADLALAAKRIAWGKFLNAGQTCVAPDHVWAPSTMVDAFVEEMRKYITAFYGENPLESEDLPAIINEKHFQRLLGLMGEGRPAIGGIWDEKRRKISPTVLANVDESHPAMGEEIFGPILPVLGYEDLDALVAHLREDNPRPLACYVFSQDSAEARKIMESFSFGGGCINDTVVHLTNSALPFGGNGESGMGRCHGAWGFDTFTNKKAVLQKGRMETDLRYPPHGGKGLGLLKKIM